MTPTMEADIRLAMVPASMARNAQAREFRFLVGRQRADSADLNADRAEIREIRKARKWRW